MKKAGNRWRMQNNLYFCAIYHQKNVMKREVYESQRDFAGEKRPSMQRRCVDHESPRTRTV